MEIINDYYTSENLELKIEEGIFYITYIGPLNVDDKVAEELRLKRIAFLNGRRLPTISQAKGELYITRSGRKKFKEIYLNKDVIALGIVVSTEVQRLMAKLYMRNVNHQMPIKIFKNLEEAKVWVTSIKE